MAGAYLGLAALNFELPFIAELPGSLESDCWLRRVSFWELGWGCRTLALSNGLKGLLATAALWCKM